MRKRKTTEELQASLKDINNKLRYVSGYENSRSDCVFMHTDFPDEPFTAKWVSVITGRANHPKLRKCNIPATNKELDNRIKSKQPHLTYVSGYKDWRSVCIFKHEDYPETFTGAWNDVLQGKIKHPNTTFGSSEKELQNRLKQYQPHLTYISGYKDCNSLCLFNDEKYGEFEGVWRSVLIGCKKNPNRPRPRKRLVNGESVIDLAKKYGYSEAHMTRSLNKYGEAGLSKILESKNGVIKQNVNFCEAKIKDIFDVCGVEYLLNKTFDRSHNTPRPDFKIDSHRLIVEVDGLFWHTEEALTKRKNCNPIKYHYDRREFYNTNGYDMLAFYSDELSDKTFPIVKSMILNKLNLSITIYGRECKLGKVEPVEAKRFLDQNHMKGGLLISGVGLYFGDELISVMQVSNRKDGLHIERFATKINYVVTGGFSKILKFVINTYNPKQIISFVDLRFGNGNSLVKQGFNKIAEHVGFEWTKQHMRCNRRTYLGNTGYDYGFCKLYDYGQAKYVKILQDISHHQPRNLDL